MVQEEGAATDIETALDACAAIGAIAITAVADSGIGEMGVGRLRDEDAGPISLGGRGGIAIIVGVAANGIVLERGEVDRLINQTVYVQCPIDSKAGISPRKLDNCAWIKSEGNIRSHSRHTRNNMDVFIGPGGVSVDRATEVGIRCGGG